MSPYGYSYDFNNKLIAPAYSIAAKLIPSRSTGSSSDPWDKNLWTTSEASINNATSFTHRAAVA